MDKYSHIKLKIIELLGILIFILAYAIIFSPLYFILGLDSLYYVLGFSVCLLGLSIVASSLSTWFEYRNKTIDREEAEWYYEQAEDISKNMDAEIPNIVILDTPVPNAYAIDALPMKPVVALTTGLLETLNSDQVRAVIAHEISHIESYDVFLMTFLSTFVSFFKNKYIFLYNISVRNPWYIVLILAIPMIVLKLNYFIGLAIFYTISRSREYYADIDAARETEPQHVKSALMLINKKNVEISKNSNNGRAFGNKEPLCIIPFGGLKDGLLRTHPTLEDRIEKINDVFSENNL